jgi:rRNA maturation RNase YbeY
VVNKVLENLGIDPDTVNFSVHIVSSDEIRELNRVHRDKDKVTDVLSFPLLHIVEGQKPTRENFPLDYNHETGKVELGDIVINEAEENKDFLIEHGLLHLLKSSCGVQFACK